MITDGSEYDLEGSLAEFFLAVDEVRKAAGFKERQNVCWECGRVSVRPCETCEGCQSLDRCVEEVRSACGRCLCGEEGV